MVSIIIPTYNRSKSLKNCIKSILDQTYKNFELIIVDDCSEDDTESMVKIFSDRRIKYLKLSTRGGAYVARNKGISIMSGNYFLTWDSDDIMYPFAVEELVKVSEIDDNIDIVYAPAIFLDKNNNLCKTSSRESGYVDIGSVVGGDVPKNDSFILVKTKIMDKDNLFLGPNIDFSFYLRLVKKANKIYHLNKILGEVYLESDEHSETTVRQIPDYKKSIARVAGLEILIDDLGVDMSKFSPRRLADTAYGLTLGEILLNKRKKAIKYSLIATKHRFKYFYLIFLPFIPFSNLLLKKLFESRKNRVLKKKKNC